MKYNSADFVHSGGDSDHQEVILYKCCVWNFIWVIVSWLKVKILKVINFVSGSDLLKGINNFLSGFVDSSRH